MDIYKFDGKKVKVICIEGEEFEGVCSVDTEFETQRDFLDFEYDHTITEIYADEIKSIEEIK